VWLSTLFWSGGREDICAVEHKPKLLLLLLLLLVTLLLLLVTLLLLQVAVLPLVS
jgi:hypothetical protein